MKEMAKVRRLLNISVGLALIGSVAYCVYGYGTAETRVQAVCAEIKPGMSIPELRRFAKEHGLSLPTLDSGVTFLVESRTFGRYGCEVTLESGAVRTSKYNFAD